MGTNTLIICPLENTKDNRDVIEQEAVGLCHALKLNILATQTLTLKKINASTYLSKGHLEDAKATVDDQEIDLVYIDTHIKPGQQRDLEKIQSVVATQSSRKGIISRHCACWLYECRKINIIQHHDKIGCIVQGHVICDT